jgi:hypothetical protein
MFGYVKKIILEAEIERNTDLSKKLKEADNRYMELTTREEYKLLESFDLLKIELNEKTSKIESELKKVEIYFLEKSKILAESEDRIKNKEMELKKLECLIEIQDELNTVKPVAQPISGINSSEIKKKINENKLKQKSEIKSGKAWSAYENFYWNDNLTAGKAKQRRLAKFLLAAFNAETDNFIGLSKKGNFHKSHKAIEKWFEKINKLGEDWSVTIERSFLKLRLEELRIVVEYHLQREFEKEEERYVNESIREEKRVQKEIEAFVKSREKEEKKYKDEIDLAKEELKASSDAELEKLKLLIEDLQFKLERSSKEKERAMSMAQLTRSGHVYIISNEGSFGRGVYKIGMTRRLDPMDRVKELGDASVPFFFDVHGIIHSDDAPGLERELHKRFEACRVNKENYRREFFRVSIDDIEKAICEIHEQTSLDRLESSTEKQEKGVFQGEY